MRVFFTIDVEGHIGSDPIKRLVLGETKNGKKYGIDFIMDELDRYRMTGIFFVDIAEAWDYGTEQVAYVLKHIKDRGHDVGVHIHPDHMADKKRLFLSEYSPKEQYEIIRKCTEFYEKVLGEKPLAFRAGKYGANLETLEILAELNYKADFSEFYGQKWCHIDPPVAKTNIRKLQNGLIEVPVTSYISLDTWNYKRHDKLDIGQQIGEFKAVFEELEHKGNNVAVMFAHSFSLIDWRRTPNEPKYNPSNHKKLIKQLEYVTGKGYKVESVKGLIRDIDNLKYPADLNQEDFVTLRGIKPFIWTADRAMTVLQSRYDIKYRKL